MTRTESAAYAKRIYVGQSSDLGLCERARRIQKGLLAQGMKIRDADITVNGKRPSGWADAVSMICVADALNAFKSASGLTLAEKVAAVERVMKDGGFDLADVLPASQRYWSMLQSLHTGERREA